MMNGPVQVNREGSISPRETSTSPRETSTLPRETFTLPRETSTLPREISTLPRAPLPPAKPYAFGLMFTPIRHEIPLTQAEPNCWRRPDALHR